MLRGDLGVFPVGGAASLPTELCYGSTTSTSQLFSENPEPSSGYWVLIRAASVSCGSASYGWRKTNGTPTTERLSSTCP